MSDQLHGECFYGPIPTPSEIEMARALGELRAELNKVKAESENRFQIIKSDCEIDRIARESAKRVLTEFEVEGDSYGVPNVATIVDKLVASLETTRAENERLRGELEHWIQKAAKHAASPLITTALKEKE